jgi:hypothetical protein
MEKENDQKHSDKQLAKNTRCRFELTFRKSTYNPKKKYIANEAKNIKEKASGIVMIPFPQD